jgi:hypothetical protein
MRSPGIALPVAILLNALPFIAVPMARTRPWLVAGFGPGSDLVSAPIARRHWTPEAAGRGDIRPSASRSRPTVAIAVKMYFIQ